MVRVKPIIMAVGGGKGGIGKSLITANLGMALARLEHSTLLIDADLGGSDLHNILGQDNIGPGLGELLTGKGLALEDLIRPVLEPRLYFVPGDSCLPAAANPRFQKKRKLFHDMGKLAQEFILLDLGAGSSITVTDFFLASPFSLLVMTPERAAELNAFNFLKNMVYRLLSPLGRANPALATLLQTFQQRGQGPGSGAMSLLLAGPDSKLDSKLSAMVRAELKRVKPKLVVNRVRKIDDFIQARQVQDWARQDLGLDLEVMAFLPEDQVVIEAAQQGIPALDVNPRAPFCRALALLGLKLAPWAGRGEQWVQQTGLQDSFTRSATEFAPYFSARPHSG